MKIKQYSDTAKLFSFTLKVKTWKRKKERKSFLTTELDLIAKKAEKFWPISFDDKQLK
jgi:hypothetical protein